MDFLIDGEASSGDSTDDGENDLVMTVVAAFQRRPCPWVRFGHKLLMCDVTRNLWVCVRVDGCGSAPSWICLKRKTALKFLQLDERTSFYPELVQRHDIKVFLVIQSGELLHRIRAAETFYTSVHHE